MLNTHTFQSVDQIIDATGGNVAKIRSLVETKQAPLFLGVLAADKVKQIRDAAMAERQTPPTVAQQLLNPQPAAPSGLGATPEAAQIAQLGAAPPPMQAPPMQAPPMDIPMSEEEAPTSMAAGGSTDKYRLPRMREESRPSGIEDMIRAIMATREAGPFSITPRYDLHGGPNADVAFDQDIGRARVHARHDMRGNRTDYGVDMPLGRGNLSIGASAARGFVPDAVRANYRMEFANGGLAALPVPDGMFDEPDNGGYANGGLVAFAEGGASRTPMGPWFEAEVKRLFPGAVISGRARTPERNRQVGGVGNSFHLTNDALDVRPPPGMSFTEFGNALRSHFGPSIDTIFNTKGHYDHVHLEPGPSRAGKRAPKGWERMPSEGGSEQRTSAPAQGERRSINDVMGEIQQALGTRSNEKRDALLERLLGTPEERAKEKDRAMGYALLEAAKAFGRPGPFLGQVGEALGNMAGPLREGAKQAREDELAALKAQAEAERQDWTDKAALLGPSIQMSQQERQSQESALDRAARMQELDKRLAVEVNEGRLTRENAYRIAALKPPNMSDMDTLIAIYKRGDQAEIAAAEKAIKAQNEAKNAAMRALIPGLTDGAAAGGAGGAGGGANPYAGYSFAPAE